MNIDVMDVGINLINLFEIVGEEKFLEISRLYGGNNEYIPTYKSVIRCSRNRKIMRKFNGVNAKELASEYGISVNHVKSICK